MNLYLLERTDDSDSYDVWLGFVICAENEPAAREMARARNKRDDDMMWPPDDVAVTYLGWADDNVEAGILLEDFRAG